MKQKLRSSNSTFQLGIFSYLLCVSRGRCFARENRVNINEKILNTKIEMSIISIIYFFLSIFIRR